LIHEHIVETNKQLGDSLFKEPAATLSERNQARRLTIEDRVAKCSEIVNATDDPYLVWCNLNDESKLLTQAINGAVEIKGSDKPEHKEEAMISFVNGDVKRLVTKPSIAGFGMNWQHCSQMAFVGLNDSNEQLYQAIRRCYRFGQKNPVNVHLISSDIEGAVLENIKRKEAQAEQMAEEMSKHVAHLTKSQVRALDREKTEYVPQSAFKIPSFMEVYS
jgi:superfamily II DNA or RNA helicase